MTDLALNFVTAEIIIENALKGWTTTKGLDL